MSITRGRSVHGEGVILPVRQRTWMRVCPGAENKSRLTSRIRQCNMRLRSADVVAVACQTFGKSVTSCSIRVRSVTERGTRAPGFVRGSTPVPQSATPGVRCSTAFRARGRRAGFRVPRGCIAGACARPHSAPAPSAAARAHMNIVTTGLHFVDMSTRSEPDF